MNTPRHSVDLQMRLQYSPALECVVDLRVTSPLTIPELATVLAGITGSVFSEPANIRVDD